MFYYIRNSLLQVCWDKRRCCVYDIQQAYSLAATCPVVWSYLMSVTRLKIWCLKLDRNLQEQVKQFLSSSFLLPGSLHILPMVLLDKLSSCAISLIAPTGSCPSFALCRSLCKICNLPHC